MRTTISATSAFGVLAVVLGLAVSSTPANAALEAYYPLNGNLNDTSGNGNNGTGAVDLTYGNGGIVSNGSDPNQYFNSPVNINNFSQVTFGGWFETTIGDPPPFRGLITNDAGGFGRGIDIDNRNGTNGYAAFNGNGVFGQAGGVTPSSGSFDFVAVIYNNATQTQTLDVNGNFFTSTGSAPPAGEPFLTIGKNYNFDSPYAGTIKDVFIYDTALTPDQLNFIQANGVPEPESIIVWGLGACVGLLAARRRKA